ALRKAMPGISANLLSARLPALTEARVIKRIALPAPAAVAAYALTERAEGLRPVVDSLALWGYELLEPETEYEQGWEARPSWLTATLAGGRRPHAPAWPRTAAVDPSALAGLDGRTFNFAVDGDLFTVRVSDGVARVRHGVLDDPDAALVTDLRSYVELPTGATE